MMKHKLEKLTLIFVSLMLIVSLNSFTPKTHAQTTYSYTLNGPYFYDGTVPFDGTATVAVLWINGSELAFNMTAIAHTANVTTFTSTSPAYQMLWNASTILNYTSIIDFQPTVTNYNISVFVPSPLIPSFIYTFPVTDFYGMTHPYLRVSLSTDGTNYTMLQQADLTSAAEPAFVLAQYGTYQLSFLCDQGTYTQMFTAQNAFTTTLQVYVGAFPTTNITTPTTIVTRLNESMVGISYIDPTLSTSWVYVLITHPSGTLTVIDYVTNNTGNTQTILWNGGDIDKDYSVNVTALVGSQEYIWVNIAAYISNTNPLIGIFDFLGQHVNTIPHITTGWPANMTSLQIAQLIGSAIIVLFLCIGSFRSAGACCILSWIIAGVLMYLGWWGNSTTTYSTVPMFIFAGFVGLLIHFGEARQTERE